MLPGAARLARLPAEPSSEAKRRLLVVNWYEQHGRKARLTARHFGRSPDTVCRWVESYRKCGPAGLETGSRRPRNVRQPQTPPHVTQRILELREENPGCGREKLHRLLLAEGMSISPKSIDRVIAASRPAGCSGSQSRCGRRQSRTSNASGVRTIWLSKNPAPSLQLTGAPVRRYIAVTTEYGDEGLHDVQPAGFSPIRAQESKAKPVRGRRCPATVSPVLVRGGETGVARSPAFVRVQPSRKGMGPATDPRPLLDLAGVFCFPSSHAFRQ